MKNGLNNEVRDSEIDCVKRDVNKLKPTVIEILSKLDSLKISMNTRQGNFDKRIKSAERNPTLGPNDHIQKSVNDLRYEVDFINGRIQSLMVMINNSDTSDIGP